MFYYQGDINQIRPSSFPSSFLHKPNLKFDSLYIPKAMVKKGQYEEQQGSQWETACTREEKWKEREEGK